MSPATRKLVEDLLRRASAKSVHMFVVANLDKRATYNEIVEIQTCMKEHGPPARLPAVGDPVSAPIDTEAARIGSAKLRQAIARYHAKRARCHMSRLNWLEVAEA